MKPTKTETIEAEDMNDNTAASPVTHNPQEDEFYKRAEASVTQPTARHLAAAEEMDKAGYLMSGSAGCVADIKRAIAAIIAKHETSEIEELRTSLPMVDDRVRNQSRELLGPVLRHDDGNSASHGCVEVMKAHSVIETLIAHKDAALAKHEQGANERMRSVLQSIVDGAVHPDKAVRRVMVDLEPIRAALAKFDAKEAR